QISRNYFHGNGVSGDASMHNAYTEAIGTVYEYNYFGQPVNGTAGDNIKDRSAGIVVRYNYLEGGTYAISLRDPESNGAHEHAAVDSLGDKLTKHAFVYGNLFRLRGSSSMMIGHGDGVAYGGGGQYRHGNLFFYGNKVISEFNYEMYHRDATTLFQMLNERDPATVTAINNLFYAKGATAGAKAAPFSIFWWQGKANFQNNWINTAFDLANPNWGGHSGNTFVGSKFNGAGLGGLTADTTSSPGFVNLSGGDFSPATGSVFTKLKGALPSDITARGLSPVDVPVQFPPLVSK